MPIYTKTGDRGETSLFQGQRLLKSALLIEAYGTLDELSSFIGLVQSKNKKNKKILSLVQKDLYQIMAYLSGAKIDLSFIDKQVLFFEKTIDQITQKLPPIKNFLLPQGSELSCWFHVLRTVCRRSERAIVRYFAENQDLKTENKVIVYLNRLSDLFFMMSRLFNNQKEVVIIK
jgi:cob(I)alamin adenosyltransferase